MSHFSRIKTAITDRGCLIKALTDLAFKAEHIEQHEEPQHLYGYLGDRRPQTAEVIIRCKYIGTASNDIGFALQPDGSYEAIISEFDERSMGYNAAWLDHLKQHYAYHKVLQEAEYQGFVVVEETNGQGEIQLTLEKAGGF